MGCSRSGRGPEIMTSSFVVCFLLLQFLSSSSSLPFHFTIGNENSPNFSGDGEIDGASSNSTMNSLRWIGSLRAVAKNWIVRSGVTSSDPAATAAAAAQGEHQEAGREGTTGGAAVVHRRWSFEPASCWKTVLQTSGLIKERLNEKIFFLERLFHRVASFFSNFFFGHESKRQPQVELLHAEQLQKKEKKQQHAAVVHDDFMIKYLQKDGRIISHDHHVPAGPACTTLRQKLASIVTKIVLEGMMESTHKTQSIHALKKNLKYMVGDLMELEIVKQLCDVPQAGSDSMSSSPFSSPCEQKFCDVFLSDPKIGILMAFSALKINPVKAAMDPQAVVNRLQTPPSPLHYHNYFHKRRVPSQADKKWLFKLAQTKKQLSHIIIQGVERLITKQNIVEAQKHASLSSSAATSAKQNRNFLNYLFTDARSFDGELNPCKACLRQEIFRWKRLTPKVLAVTCSSESSATHPSLTAACEFVKENKLVATTMFAYNLKIWERAAEACKSRVLNSCDFPRGLFLDHQQLLKQQQQHPVHHTRGGGKTTTSTHHHQQQQHPITTQVHNRNNKGRAPGVLHHVLQPHTKALNSLTTESVIKLATATEMLSWHDEHTREQPGTPSPQMHKLLFIRSIRYHHQHHPAITNCASSELPSFPEGTATAAGSGSGVSLKDKFLLLGDLFKQQEQQEVEAVRSSVAKFLPKGGNKTLRIVGKFSRNFELVRKHRDSSQFDTTVL